LGKGQIKRPEEHPAQRGGCRPVNRKRRCSVKVTKLVGLVAVVWLVALGVAWSEEQASAIRYGADERIREEYFDSLPVKSGAYTRGGENNYFRFRTRVWGEMDLMENVTLRGRLANEFRIWDKPDMSARPQASNWEFPDEVVFDTLYLEARDLLDKKLDVRIGRQDLIYGTGKVILEGTPGDGSRTIYFNAAKAVWKGFKDTAVDVFGIYNPAEDDLAMDLSGDMDAYRNLTVYSTRGGPWADVTESGAGVYVKNKSVKGMPLEVYGLYKQEGDYELTNGTAIGQLDLGTLGFRLMPELAKNVKGNLEVAYQLGERGDQDVQGAMVDASVNCQLPMCEAMKPAVEAELYYLSGDDGDTAKDEGWDPLWARYPQFSELYVFCFDAESAGGRWSNLLTPRLTVTASPAKWLKTTAAVSYLYAPEADGAGGGHTRGWLGQAKAEFTIAEKLLTQKDKLTGHLQVDLLDPGDYYTGDDTGIFARWEMAYAF
jgi:hypothetical protein